MGEKDNLPATTAIASAPTVGTPVGPLNSQNLPTGTILQVVDAAGHPLSSIVKDAPFWIRALLQRPPGSSLGGGHASGIAAIGGATVTENVAVMVKLQVGSSQSTVTLTGGPGGSLTLTSEPIVLGGSSSVPVEGVKSEPVTVTYADGAETVTVTGDAYENGLQQAWQATSDTFQLYDAYWRQMAMGLRDVVITPTTDRTLALLKMKSEQAIGVLDKGRVWLNDPSQLLTTQIQMGQFFLRPLQDRLENFDPRKFGQGGGEADERQRIHDSSQNDILMPGLCAVAVGYYQVMVGMVPFAGSFFTLVTGLSITGQAASRLDALEDAAEQAVFLGLGHRFRVMDNVARRAPKMGRVKIPKLPTGKDPVRGVPEGTAVRAEGHGMLPQAARYTNFICEEERVFIEVRGTNTGALADRATGHPGKHVNLKPKTINDTDILLGANPEAAGHAWVGYFEPKLPVRPPDMTNGAWSDLTARFNERTVEFADCKVKMDHLVHDGVIRIDKGVVVDTGLCGNTGKPVTGDYDLWKITNRDGTALSPEQLTRVMSKLRQNPFHAEHNAHTEWVIDQTKMTPEDYQTALRVNAGVWAKHAPGNDSLIIFRGLGRPTIAGYAQTGPGPYVRTPLVPDGLGPTLAPELLGGGGPNWMPGLFPPWLAPRRDDAWKPPVSVGETGPIPSPVERAASGVIAADQADNARVGRPGKTGPHRRSGWPRWVPVAGVATAIALGAGLGVASGLNRGSSIGPTPVAASPPAVGVTPDPAAAPVTPAPVPAPADWTLGSTGTYFNNGPGDSTLWDCLSTSPAQPGAAFTDVIVKPDASTTTTTGVLDAAGKATVATPINEYGPYTQTESVNSGGITKTESGTTTVTSTQGQQCP